MKPVVLISTDPLASRFIYTRLEGSPPEPTDIILMPRAQPGEARIALTPEQVQYLRDPEAK